LWKVKPNFAEGVKKWIEIGGGHHTVVSLALNTQQIIDWATMVNLDYELIK
jgi:L-arabinose isomerase